MTRIGILGGGQLAQMLTQAAISLGIDTAIFDRFADSPASRLTHFEVAGSWDNTGLLHAFAAMCSVVTLENEFVDARILRQLEDEGLLVFPTAETLASIQDKLVQKRRYEVVGLPVPRFRGVETPRDVLAAAEEYGWPLLLKARRDAYDGKGNTTLHNQGELAINWEGVAAGGRLLMAEAFVPFVKELAVMIVRARDGEIRAYPVVETIQQNHICTVVRAPAPIPFETAERATEIAARAVEVIEGVGVFGVELFLLESGDILINEIAPRPHNSGHYSIEACVTSQFENHLRAVLGLPLGVTDMLFPAAVMVNVLGNRDGSSKDDISRALAVPGTHLHLYGKREVRVGRKMGHVTALGMTLEEAEAAAQQAADLVEL
ncbi:MAG: 5-(carboxyamino)imidazole ribonucleotide synthase [Anaerolineae bacterium]